MVVHLEQVRLLITAEEVYLQAGTALFRRYFAVKSTV